MATTHTHHIFSTSLHRKSCHCQSRLCNSRRSYNPLRVIFLKKQLVLASQSKRRRDLLKEHGFCFVVQKSRVKEIFKKNLSPRQNALLLSQQKATDVAKRKNGVILAADTIVVLKNHVLGKPKNKKDASKMLKMLSNSTHTVITAFTILDTETGKKISKAVSTQVTFKKLINTQIEDYILKEKPYDKAGGYAAQEGANSFIQKIKGSFSNVVGLPMEETIKALKKFGICSSLYHLDDSLVFMRERVKYTRL